MTIIFTLLAWIALVCLIGLLSEDGKFERHRGRVIGSKLSEESADYVRRLAGE